MSVTGAGRDGVCVVDKPAGMTSHDVVARARRLFGTRRVGHAGTLDPDATGVLVLGIGRATRLLRFVTPLTKSYSGEVVLGVATSTLDASGDVIATCDMGHVTLEAVQAAAAGFVGDLAQVPPMVSAVRIGGRRLHQLARQGIEVERNPRPVTVHRFEVAGPPEPVVVGGARGWSVPVEVDCSSGTYVRTLADDLGRALGGGAHLRNLRRNAVGPFTVESASSIDDLAVRPSVDAVRHLEMVAVDEDVAALVTTGTRLVRRGEAVELEGDGPWALVSASTGALLAVYEAVGERAHPVVVVAPPATEDPS
ncbi:MAG TPA: tRNA pseudouridine(55) synthase TruB [Acidimicrobiales bacterium]|nr:tRNA pseudouridine(55) synthase TruB [Acidimicrobiales bacterium]